MKILIISFDKRLSEELKKVFAKEEVIVVKNSEEALKIAPTHVDIVVYDAISGAISEDDINNLYQKKFSDSRYIILFDELFPVNKDNLMPENKVLVPREEDPKKVKEIALSSDTEPSTAREEKTQEQPQTTEEAPKEEEVPPLDDSLIELSHVPEPKPEEPQSPAETQPPAEPEPEIEFTSMESQAETPPTTEEFPSAEVPTQEETASKKRKALLVSFDATLIDSVREILGSEYEIETVKNTRQAIEKGEDSDIVIYDAISGVIAEKGLTELSENPKFSKKPYLVLVDDLFPIDVDSINLPLKKSISRDSRENLKSLVEELILQSETTFAQEEPQVETVQEPQMSVEEPQTPAETQMEIEEEEIPALENLDKIVEELEKGMAEEASEPEPAEEEQEAVIEPAEDIEESIPPIEELAKEVVEETKPQEEAPEQPQPVKTEETSEVPVESIGNLEEVIRNAVTEKLGSLNLEGLIANLVKESVREAVSGIDVAQIVREETAKILKQKVEELLK